MNDDFENDSDRQELDERLRWQLRALRTDAPPQRDLWPGIAARLEAQRPRVPHHRGLAWLAAAAAVVMAFGIGWRLHAVAHAPATGASLVQREAEAMTRDYDAAIRRLQASAPAAAHDPVLRELDRSAGLIRNALQSDPDAGFLLQRLRHTYEKRLALTQRELLG